jgi:hypothetical protein
MILILKIIIYFIQFFLKEYIYNMSLATEASKLLTNKYFLYFMVFLAATNVLGYLVTNKVNAVIFFALVSLLTYQFSKNMAVVLLVSIIATNFLMANKRMREGLENQTDDSTQALSTIEDKDPQIAEAIPAVQEAKNNEQVTTKLNGEKKKRPIAGANSANGAGTVKQALSDKIVDTNNADLNQTTDSGEIEGFGDKMGGRKGAKSESSGPRIDYAATIEQSYENLDNLLGSNSIQKLTADTQKLMKQQQSLFDTMQNMVPVLQGAQDMLKGFDVGGLTNSLKNIGGLANAPIAATNK